MGSAVAKGRGQVSWKMLGVGAGALNSQGVVGEGTFPTSVPQRRSLKILKHFHRYYIISSVHRPWFFIFFF